MWNTRFFDEESLAEAARFANLPRIDSLGVQLPKDLVKEMGLDITAPRSIPGLEIILENPKRQAFHLAQEVAKHWEVSEEDIRLLIKHGHLDSIIPGTFDHVSGGSYDRFFEKYVPTQFYDDTTKTGLGVDGKEYVNELTRFGSKVNRINIPETDTLWVEHNDLQKKWVEVTKGDGNHYRALIFGYYLIAQSKKPRKTISSNLLTLENLCNGFGIENNSHNRQRINSYFLEGQLEYEHVGLIPETVDRIHPNKDKDELRALIQEIYLPIYFSFFIDKAGILADPSIVEHKELPFFNGLLDMRTTEEDIVSFLENGFVTPQELFMSGFEGCEEYLEMNRLQVHELLEQEAALYLPKDFSIVVLRPFEMGKGDAKVLVYPVQDKEGTNLFSFQGVFEGDLETINTTLENLLPSIHMGMLLKIGLKNYEVDNTGFSVEDVAKILGTSIDKASRLPLKWQDTGIIQQVSVDDDDFKFDDIEQVYNKFYKDKVEGFSDDAVRNFRVSQQTIDGLLEQNFPDSVLDVATANKELVRQYKIDGVAKTVLSEYLEAFSVDDRLVNTSEDNETITRMLTEHPEMRRRIEWGLALQEYDVKTSTEEYTPVDEFKEQMRLSEKDFKRLEEFLPLHNPAVDSLNPENGDVAALHSFHDKYFGRNGRLYVLNSEVDRLDFVPQEELAEHLTGIAASFSTLEAAAKKQGVMLSQLVYRYKSELKQGDEQYYLVQEAQKRKSEDVLVKKIQVALALDKFEPTLKKYAQEMGCVTKSEARKILGVDKTELERLAKHGLAVRDIGLGTELELLVSARCSDGLLTRDEIYTHSALTMKFGVGNLNEFIDQTETLDNVRDLYFGYTPIAQKLFDYYLKKNPLNLIVLTIDGEKRLSAEYSKRLQSQMEHGYRTELASLIRQEIGVEKIPDHYHQLSIPPTVNKEALINLATRISEFKENCHDLSSEESQVQYLGFTFSNPDSIVSVFGAVQPTSISFSDKYHISDIEVLRLAVDVAAESIEVSSQKVVEFVESEYVQLDKNGIERKSLSQLLSNSYSDSDMQTISPNVIALDQVEDNLFAQKDTFYCHADIVRQQVLGSEISDISLGGVMMLSNGNEWLAAELNGNADKAGQLINYLYRAIHHSKPEDDRYSAKECAQLFSLMDVLEENDIHNLDRFKRKNKTIDVDQSYLTRAEALQVSGMGNEKFDKHCLAAGVHPVEGANIQLYTVRGVADVISSRNESWSSFKDPLDRYILSAITYNDYLPGLKPTFRDGRLVSIDKQERRELARALKLDTELCSERLPRIFNEVLYQVGVTRFGEEGNSRDYLVRQGELILQNLIQQKV